MPTTTAESITATKDPKVCIRHCNYLSR